MKFVKIALLAGFAMAATGQGAFAQAAAEAMSAAPAPAESPACVPEKLSSDSMVGDLLDNAAAKALLIKHVPEMKDNDQIDQARSMSLRSLQAYAAETFTDKVLADLDTDLATIPVCPAK